MSNDRTALGRMTRGAIAAPLALTLMAAAPGATVAAPSVPEVPCRLVLSGSSGNVVKPGESITVWIGLTVQYLCDECPPELPPPEGAISWAVTGASLGEVGPSSGRIEAGDLEELGRLNRRAPPRFSREVEFTYHAGDREGKDVLPLDLEHPECESPGEPAIDVYVDVNDWGLNIYADYEGLTGQTDVLGETRWYGTFRVVEDDRLEGSGTYYQLNSGTCFYYYVRNEFRIGGAIEDGYFRFEFLDYRTESEVGPLVPEDLRCVLKAAAQGVDLLAGVARDAVQFEEAVVRVPSEGRYSADSTYSTFRIGVSRR